MMGVHFRRVVALGVITSLAVTGCASARNYAHPDLRDRSSQIASIGAVPVNVSVFRLGVGGGAPLLAESEWSETARTNLRNAIAKHFGTDPHLSIKEFDPREALATEPELRQVHNVMGNIVAAMVENGVECLPGPTPTLVDASGTDALLLVYASDRTRTAGVRAARVAAIVGLVVATVVLVPIIVVLCLAELPRCLGGAVGGVATHGASERHGGASEHRVAALDTITLCLVDPRKGDVLWFHLEPIGSGDLLNASNVERLIGNAYAKFRQSAHQ